MPSNPTSDLPRRKIGFVLASTNHGTLIVNRFDYHMLSPGNAYGVGHNLLDQSCYEPEELSLALQLLGYRRQYFGDGVVALDCGANIGVFTVEWARAMTGWGTVLAVEAQERLYYALAGNIAINNCFNAVAVHGAVSSESGILKIPNPNYFVPSSFGSLELRQREGNEFIGQPIDYAEDKMMPVNGVTIDSFALPRLDLIKLDVERMELAVLEGARQTIGRCLPIIVVEQLKTDAAALDAALAAHGYRRYRAGLNLVAVHPSDATSNHVIEPE